jgi:hypothetical protein
LSKIYEKMNASISVVVVLSSQSEDLNCQSV